MFVEPSTHLLKWMCQSVLNFPYKIILTTLPSSIIVLCTITILYLLDLLLLRRAMNPMLAARLLHPIAQSLLMDPQPAAHQLLQRVPNLLTSPRLATHQVHQRARNHMDPQVVAGLLHPRVTNILMSPRSATHQVYQRARNRMDPLLVAGHQNHQFLACQLNHHSKYQFGLPMAHLNSQAYHLSLHIQRGTILLLMMG